VTSHHLQGLSSHGRGYLTPVSALVLAGAAALIFASFAYASIYRVVPLAAPTLLPSAFGSNRSAQLRHMVLNGTPIDASTWTVQASLDDIRGEVRNMLHTQYTDWSAKARRDSAFDNKREKFLALPRVISAPGWLGITQLEEGSLTRTGLPTSRVALILPTGDAKRWLVWETSMPTRSVFETLVRAPQADAPGHDYAKAGRPDGSIRTFSLEEVSGNLHTFSASYTASTAPRAAVEEILQRLLAQGFTLTQRTTTPDQTLVGAHDATSEVSIFAAGAGAGEDTNAVTRIVVSVIERTV
jgi:hypothetical protein